MDGVALNTRLKCCETNGRLGERAKSCIQLYLTLRRKHGELRKLILEMWLILT